MENQFRTVLPEKVEGIRKTGKGVYVPSREEIHSHIAKLVPEPKNLPEYIPQGNELHILDVKRKNQMPVLLSGPTGIGKTLLATTYAARCGLPLLLFPAHEDVTDWSMRGSVGFVMAPLRDESTGRIHDVKLQTFSPAQVALAAMAQKPVVLFLDDLHKIRPAAASVLHGLLNRNERTLYCYDLSGENFTLHPQTLVMAAVNPSYGEGGIERLDAALRRRFSTIELGMPERDTVIKIILANVGEVNAKTKKLIRYLADIQEGIIAARDGGNRPNNAASIPDPYLDTETLSSIIEVPSPASIVETVRDVLEGLSVMDAIVINMINTVVGDFGHAARGLRSYIESKIPENLRD